MSLFLSSLIYTLYLSFTLPPSIKHSESSGVSTVYSSPQDIDGDGLPDLIYTPSAGYGTPFNVYEPVYVDSYQHQQQQRKYVIILLTRPLTLFSERFILRTDFWEACFMN